MDYDLDAAKDQARSDAEDELKERIEEEEIYCPRCLDSGCYYCEH